jgi:hypothetical protein
MTQPSCRSYIDLIRKKSTEKIPKKLSFVFFSDLPTIFVQRWWAEQDTIFCPPSFHFAEDGKKTFYADIIQKEHRNISSGSVLCERSIYIVRKYL